MGAVLGAGVGVHNPAPASMTTTVSDRELSAAHEDQLWPLLAFRTAAEPAAGCRVQTAPCPQRQYSHKAGSILRHSKVCHGHIHPASSNPGLLSAQHVPEDQLETAAVFAQLQCQLRAGINAPASACCRMHNLEIRNCNCFSVCTPR